MNIITLEDYVAEKGIGSHPIPVPVKETNPFVPVDLPIKGVYA